MPLKNQSWSITRVNTIHYITPPAGNKLWFIIRENTNIRNKWQRQTMKYNTYGCGTIKQNDDRPKITISITSGYIIIRTRKNDQWQIVQHETCHSSWHSFGNALIRIGADIHHNHDLNKAVHFDDVSEIYGQIFNKLNVSTRSLCAGPREKKFMFL